MVGAGAIGASAAYALARDGHEVVVLDRGAIGMGASSGTACMVTASHAERMATRAMLLEGIRFLPDPAGPFALRPTPRLLPWLARFTAASLTGDAHGRDGAPAKAGASRASSSTAGSQTSSGPGSCRPAR